MAKHTRAQMGSEKANKWADKHHGHNIIRESEDTVHCVRCQEYFTRLPGNEDEEVM